MEKLFIELLEVAKKADKETLRDLKIAAVKLQQFALAAELRALEKERFPYSMDVSEAVKIAEKTRDALSLINLVVPNDIAWVIYQIVKTTIEREKAFDSNDFVKLTAVKEELFNEPAQQ